MRAKIFGQPTIQLAEAAVNDWLIANPLIQIKHVLQSESGSNADDWTITITIFYSEHEG